MARGRVMRRSVAALAAASLAGCTSDPLKGLDPGTGPAVSDAALFALIPAGPSWTYYKRSATPIARSSGPHPQTHALVRFNERAATQLDAAGKVRSGAAFPDSSIIVKELSDGSTVAVYAVMMKATGSASAGFGGWVWAEFNANGSVKYSTQGRGGACSACHSSGIDYTRMNDTHP